jgi:hypothetical protein
VAPAGPTRGAAVSRTRPKSGFALAAAIALTVLAVTVVRNPLPAAGDTAPFPGMAGTDISLPRTDSAVTVAGHGPFAGMRVTVNQTRDLVDQAVSVTWSGAPPTVSEGTKFFFGNFVQVMQCWGEPDGAVPGNPGPPPEQCVWGAKNPNPSSELQGFATPQVTQRSFSQVTFPDFDPNVGTVDESGEVFRDFRAVDGTVVKKHVDYNATGPFANYWQNPYFSSVTSNELPGLRTLPNGTGQGLMTVETGVESRGLGCGQRVQPSPGAQPKVPRCWLVVVPRGLPEVENVGNPNSPTIGVATSPMRPESWKNRIAIELAFTPVDSPCDLAAEQRQITGTELMVGAVGSWQPVLCTQPGLRPYAYGVVSDALARQQLVSNVAGAPGMVAVNRPLSKSASKPDDPILYAPLTASGITVGFNIERIPSLASPSLELRGIRYTDIHLTPRLVAKLLTQSYKSQVEISGSNPYSWDDANPLDMLGDPDFLRFNPEFTLWQSGSSRAAGGLSLPIGSADLATQVWEWILADPEASAWLAGKRDEWGMGVNPVYNTKAGSNSSGVAFAEPTPDSFPKSEPYCYQEPKLFTGVTPPPLCSLDWTPYAAGFADAAKVTSTASDGARIVLDRFAGTETEVWRRSIAQTLGRRTMFGLTDLPAASKLGLQTAKLSRAGDNGANRQFIAPDSLGLSRAVQSMKNVDGMLRLDPRSTAAGAYPLTTMTYAAVRPFSQDDTARKQYAAFLDHAAGPGQVAGQKLGQLPPGYLPLPASLKATTATVANQLRTLEPPAEPSQQPGGNDSTPPPSGGSSDGSDDPSDFGDDGSTSSGEDATSEDTTDSVNRAGAPTRRQSPESIEQISQRTPSFALGLARYAVVAVALIALIAALVALEITKHPRRRSKDASTSSGQPPMEAAGAKP